MSIKENNQLWTSLLLWYDINGISRLKTEKKLKCRENARTVSALFSHLSKQNKNENDQIRILTD